MLHLRRLCCCDRLAIPALVARRPERWKAGKMDDDATCIDEPNPCVCAAHAAGLLTPVVWTGLDPEISNPGKFPPFLASPVATPRRCHFPPRRADCKHHGRTKKTCDDSVAFMRYPAAQS